MFGARRPSARRIVALGVDLRPTAFEVEPFNCPTVCIQNERQLHRHQHLTVTYWDLYIAGRPKCNPQSAQC
eukprot:8841336-Alexandrium_andersonii.AAC.1